MSAALGLCLLGCVVVFIAAIPQFREEVRDGVHDAVATEMARQIPPGVPPGSYVVSDAELQANLRQQLDDEDSDDEALIVVITPDALQIGITSPAQDAIYTGTPDVEDGRLVMRGMDTDSGVVGFLLPPGDVGDAIEEAVNEHLAANGLALESIELGEGEMTLTVRNT